MTRSSYHEVAFASAPTRRLLLRQNRWRSRSAGIEHFRDTIFGGGQGWERCMRLCLIPVGDGIKIIRPMVGVAMLDGHFDGFVEGDGALSVPAVEAIAAADALGIDHIGSAVVLVPEGLQAEVPCAVVVVL